jgi:predicted amidohydrolase
LTRIVCQQIAPRILDLAANSALSIAAIREAIDMGADIVLLPELVTSGYVFSSAAEAGQVAITPRDPLFAAWAVEAARGRAVVIGGFCELGEDGHLYNSAAVVDGTGVIGVYRKTHLWDREKLYFRPGVEPPRVFDTTAGQIGVLICYDLEFPELTRTVALAGAELLAVPSNWPLVDRPAGERPPEVLIAMAAARVNHMFIACCDRTLTEREQRWTEGTHIIDDSGWVVANVEGEGAAVADVDLSSARDKTFSEFVHAFYDRRPELYGPVTEIAPGFPIRTTSNGFTDSDDPIWGSGELPIDFGGRTHCMSRRDGRSRGTDTESDDPG